MKPVRSLALLALAAACAFADATLEGPMLGLVYDSAMHRLRPVFGIPGAAATGDALDLGVDLSQAAVSPSRAFAVALAGDSNDAALVVWNSGTPSLTKLSGVASGADRILLSPSGNSAAFYFAQAGHVQIVTGLPDNPTVFRDVDLSFLGAAPAGFAVSDSAILVASVADANAPGMYIFAASGDLRRIPLTAGASAIAFLRGSSDVVLADGGNIVLIRDITGTAAATLLSPDPDGTRKPVAVGVSPDNSRAIVADASGTILTLNFAGSPAVSIDCGCTPAGLFGFGQVLRLTEFSKDPLLILDPASAAPRILFVPPPAAGGGAQ